MPHTIIAVVSDTHAGGTTAIAPHEFITSDGQTVQASRAQDWLYACWLDYWYYIKTLAGIRGKHRKHRLVVVHLGDAIDGSHHATTQIMPDIGDQQALFCELFRPIVTLADETLFLYGTEAHAGPAARDEKRICGELGIRNQGYALTLEADGVVIDLAHDGRAGGRPWTSSAAGMASQVALNYALDGLPPPRYVLRGHRHVIDDSGERVEGTRYISCPAWQLRTGYAYSLGPTRSDIGGVIIEGGVLRLERARYKAAPGARTTVRLAW